MEFGMSQYVCFLTAYFTFRQSLPTMELGMSQYVCFLSEVLPTIITFVWPIVRTVVNVIDLWRCWVYGFVRL